MAEAKRIKAVPPPPPPDRITLELSLEEAQVLADIAYVTGGSTENSRRKHVDAIGMALSWAGISSSSYGERAHDITPESVILFKRTM